jgi:tetratricopeptide (TPR) repeat protein
LHPRRPELRFQGRVRETALQSILDAGMGVDALECVIASAAGTADERRHECRRLLNLTNLAITEEGDHPALLLARAESLATLGRAREAGRVHQRVIELAEHGSAEMLEAYYGLLTTMAADPAAAEGQAETCLAALEAFPLDAQLLCAMGGLLLRAGQIELAARSYEMAVAHGTVIPSIWHLAELADIAVVCWSHALSCLGDRRQADAVLREALAERPESRRLGQQFANLRVDAMRDLDAARVDSLSLPHAPHGMTLLPVRPTAPRI